MNNKRKQVLLCLMKVQYYYNVTNAIELLSQVNPVVYKVLWRHDKTEAYQSLLPYIIYNS